MKINHRIIAVLFFTSVFSVWGCDPPVVKVQLRSGICHADVLKEVQSFAVFMFNSSTSQSSPKMQGTPCVDLSHAPSSIEDFASQMTSVAIEGISGDEPWYAQVLGYNLKCSVAHQPKVFLCGKIIVTEADFSAQQVTMLLNCANPDVPSSAQLASYIQECSKGILYWPSNE